MELKTAGFSGIGVLQVPKTVSYLYNLKARSLTKNSFVLAILMSCCLLGFSQTPTYEQSFEAALNTARALNKKVLVVVDANLVGLAQADVKSSTTIYAPDVAPLINQNFAVYKVKHTDAAAVSLIKNFNVDIAPSYLFFHANGDIFAKVPHSQRLSGRYKEMVKSVLTASKSPTLSDMRKAVEADSKNNGKIAALIKKQRSLSIADNADLIELYVKNMQEHEMDNYQSLLFILDAGPLIGGNAFKLAKTGLKEFEDLYKSESLSRRIAINNGMINNTMAHAIKNKDVELAKLATAYIRSTWGNNTQAGMMNAGSRMLNYWAAIGDTAQYLNDVFDHVDKYFLQRSSLELSQVNSVDYWHFRRLDSLRKVDLPNVAFEKMVKSFAVSPTKAVLSEVERPNAAGGELNSFAWTVYETGTRNRSYLARATEWAHRAIAQNPKSAYYDTLAHLLYFLGFRTDAIKAQQQAVALAPTEYTTPDRYQEVLEKMKTGTL